MTTNADKKHAILIALQTWPERSQVQIAEQIGCTQSWVSDVKKQLIGSDILPTHVTGKDGKSYPASRIQAGEPSPAIAAAVGVSASPRRWGRG